MTTAIAKTQPTVGTVLDQVRKRVSENAMLFPKGWTPERFSRIVTIAFAKNPALSECTPQSVVRAVLEAAQLGLEPDGLIGHGWLVPRNNRKKGVKEASFQIGFKGLRELVMRSGQVRSIMSGVVYAKDDFAYRIDASQPNGVLFYHEPFDGADRGVRVKSWAMAVMVNGGVQVVVCGKEQIDAARSMAQSGQFWDSHPDEMWRKTAVRKLCKDLPASAEDQRKIQRTLEVDNAIETGAELPPHDDMELAQEAEFEPAAEQNKIATLTAALP